MLSGVSMEDVRAQAKMWQEQTFYSYFSKLSPCFDHLRLCLLTSLFVRAKTDTFSAKKCVT